jgi:hypothetical protein
MADLKNQVENLKLLVSSVQSDMVARDENRTVARTTEAWLCPFGRTWLRWSRTPRRPSRVAANSPGSWSRR